MEGCICFLYMKTLFKTIALLETTVTGDKFAQPVSKATEDSQELYSALINLAIILKKAQGHTCQIQPILLTQWQFIDLSYSNSNLYAGI